MKRGAIIISGQPGAGSTTTGELLSKKENIYFFSAGRLYKEIFMGKIESNLHYEKFRQICKSKDLTLPKFSSSNESSAAAESWKTDLGNSSALHESTDELQACLAREGNVVIEGKLAIRKVPNAFLKVWLKADLKTRAKRHSLRDSISFKEAYDLLKDRQEKERIGWKNIYGFDFWDQEHDADLVIDTTNLTENQVVEIILKTLNNL